MNKDFEQIAALYGISNTEAETLYKNYGSIKNLKLAVYSDSVPELSIKDIGRLKKYFDTLVIEVVTPNIISSKKCNSCRLQLPKNLDNGICPHCKVRN